MDCKQNIKDLIIIIHLYLLNKYSLEFSIKYLDNLPSTSKLQCVRNTCTQNFIIYNSFVV